MARGRKTKSKSASPSPKTETVSPELNFGLLNQISQNGWFNNPIWMNNLLKDISTLSTKYTRDQIVSWLSNYRQHEKELMELNQYLLVSSQHFRRLVDYFIEMPKFTPILYPADSDLTEEDMKTPAFKKSMKKSYDWLEKFNCEDEGKKVFRTVLEEDIGYYYKRENDDSITFQRLPSQWCKIVSRNNVTFNIAFNFMFFWRLGINIKDYPPEFAQYVNDIEEGKRKDNMYNYWVILDPEKAVAFKFNEDTGVIKSPWIGLYLDILEIAEFKSLIKTRAALDNFLLLTQKIPMGKDDSKNNFLIELDIAGKFQELISKSLPQGIKLVTTPMELTATRLDGTGSSNRESIVGQAENAFYKSSGTSPALFGSADNKNVGIMQSLKVDETWVFRFYRQMERWINYQLRNISGTYRFKVMFPDITYYNYKDKIEMYMKCASMGYPKSLVACAMGLTPLQFKNITTFENGMGLVDSMKVLQSTHTQSGDISSSGRPNKTDDKLSDSGISTKDNLDNQNRNNID